MEPEDPEIDPELERRSRRNKVIVTIGFIVLIVGSLFMAQFLVNIVKPASHETPAPVEEPKPAEP